MGQALPLGQPVLLLHAAVVAVLVVTFVRGYAEPTFGLYVLSREG